MCVPVGSLASKDRTTHTPQNGAREKRERRIPESPGGRENVVDESVDVEEFVGVGGVSVDVSVERLWWW